MPGIAGTKRLQSLMPHWLLIRASRSVGRLQSGKTPDRVYSYMTARSGDFLVLSRPPFKVQYLFAVAGADRAHGPGAPCHCRRAVHRRSKLPDDAFDPDTPDAT